MACRNVACATALLLARGARGLAGPVRDRFRERLDDVVRRRRGDLVVVVEDCTDPANAASVARICDAFAVPDLYFVRNRAPPRFDPNGEGLRRLSASATQWVRTTALESPADAHETLRAAGFSSVASVLAQGAVALPAADDVAARSALGLGASSSKLALWLGTESQGLSEESVAGCDACVMIPMVGAVQSLNLAAAAGILVAELARLAGPAPPLDDAAAASLATDLLSQRDAWHTPQRRLRRRTAAAARGEIFRQRRRAECG